MTIPNRYRSVNCANCLITVVIAYPGPVIVSVIMPKSKTPCTKVFGAALSRICSGVSEWLSNLPTIYQDRTLTMTGIRPNAVRAAIRIKHGPVPGPETYRRRISGMLWSQTWFFPPCGLTYLETACFTRKHQAKCRSRRVKCSSGSFDSDGPGTPVVSSFPECGR